MSTKLDPMRYELGLNEIVTIHPKKKEKSLREETNCEVWSLQTYVLSNEMTHSVADSKITDGELKWNDSTNLDEINK